MFTVKPALYEIEHRVTCEDLRPIPNFFWDVKQKAWVQQLGAAEGASAGGGSAGGSASPTPGGADVDGSDDEVLEAQGELEVDVDIDMDDAE